MEKKNRRNISTGPAAEPGQDELQISDFEQETADAGAPAKPPAVTRKKKRRTAIIVILSVLVVLVGTGIYLINYYLNMIHFEDPETQSQISPSEWAKIDSSYWESVNSKEADVTTTEPRSSASASSEEGSKDPETEATEEPTEETEERVVRTPFQADAYRATLSADDEPIIFDHPVTYSWMRSNSLNDENLLNIMLVGQDTRDANIQERSDTMILVSINTKTHKVSMISFLRDLYVPIGEGYGMNRLNTAYKIGGFPFMYKCFEDNYGIHIDGGICVNFGQFMTAVDLLGGLDVTLNETEAKWLRYTLEQSVPDMRYWGMIVEAQMPTIKAGTSVKDAITALKAANLNYSYSNMNGGAAPDDVSKAQVKSFWTDAGCTSAAKAGRYYALQSTVYITYSETRAAFPKLSEEISVSSASAQLKDLGFKIAYADLNGCAAPEDGKAALVSSVTLDAAGKKIPGVGEKFAKGTTLYIGYIENKANIPTLPDDMTVKEAEALLKSVGLKIAWTDSCGGVAPADKSKATLVGIYLDSKGTKAVKSGDKLDVNAKVYLAYKDNTSTVPTIAPNSSVKDVENALKAAGFKVAYASANRGKAPADKLKATVLKITTDMAGTRVVKAGTRFEQNTTLYLTYSLPEEPTTEEPTTEAPTKPVKPTQPTTEEPTTEAPTTEEPTTEEPTTEEPTTEEPTTEAPTTEEPTTEEPTTEEPTTEEPTEASSDEDNDPDETTEPAAEPTEPDEPSSEGQTARSNEDLTEFPENVSFMPFEDEEELSEEYESPAAYTPSAAGSRFNPAVRLSAVQAASYEPEYLRGIKAGKVHLNGIQTLAYCRMRKLDSDFKRTERQRMVLNTLFNKVKSSDISTLDNLLKKLLPQVRTDLSNAEIISIAAQVLPYFSSTQISSYSIPVAGTWRNVMINGMAVVQSDQEANIEAIRSWLPY